jgi:CubicO group peptidase (beta-lactamase class C family)
MGRTTTQIKFLLLLASLILATSPLSAVELSSKIDEYISDQMKVHHFSGAILIAQGGRVLVSKGYGMANVELNVRNTPGTKFRIGPITHQFTAMAILELEKDGRLNVQDSVCQYISECPNAWKEIKIVNLLTHTSGISNFTNYERTIRTPTTVSGLLARYKNEPLESKPGEKLKYSNSGYEVLGAVIENVSGEPYAKYLAEHIFEPLGMRDTGYDSATQIISPSASGYKRVGNTLVNATYLDMSIPYSVGSLYSTVEDLYRWDRALYSEKLVSKKLLNEVFTPYRDGYGFGWKILKEFQRKALTYGGGINGFSTSIRRYPDDDSCIIVLSNLESVDAEKVGHDLGAILFGIHYELPMQPHTPNRYGSSSRDNHRFGTTATLLPLLLAEYKPQKSWEQRSASGGD